MYVSCLRSSILALHLEVYTHWWLPPQIILNYSHLWSKQHKNRKLRSHYAMNLCINETGNWLKLYTLMKFSSNHFFGWSHSDQISLLWPKWFVIAMTCCWVWLFFHLPSWWYITNMVDNRISYGIITCYIVVVVLFVWTPLAATMRIFLKP